MSKYYNLTEYLKAVAATEFVLTFDDIADIIKGHLPKSAERPRYWNNLSKPEDVGAASKAAQRSGYKTLLLEGQDRIRFMRQ